MWKPGQRVFQEVRTPAERLHKRAGVLQPLTITRTDATGRAFIEGVGYFDYTGMPLDYYGQGITGDSIMDATEELEARFQLQKAARCQAATS